LPNHQTIQIDTKRLILRQWYESDFYDFATINADSEVMKYYPSVLSIGESDDLANKIKSKIEINGWGFWAVELRENKQFIGFVGLNQPSYDLPVPQPANLKYPPCIEIGWRLSRKHWGNGYALEAAKASLDYAFHTLKLNEVYSFTPVTNRKSWSLMVRLGMTDTHANFDHPVIPAGHPLSEHRLYKITQECFLNESS